MSKIVDENGFWIIKKNPISKEGVFPYLGHTISADCEPNKVYKVYRSGKTLKESVPTWDNPPKPFIEDHEMLGEGFTAVDDRHVQGVISNPVYEDGVLYADIAVYSESLKEAIENGKKELSLGYFCKYKKESGVFDGEEYDYVQEDMVGNHIALVDAGRCGSDVKVFDSRCTMDKLDINGDDNLPLKKNEECGNIELTGQNETKDEAMAKYVLVSEVNAILKEAFKWGDGEVDPKADLIAKLLDAKSVEGVVPTTDEDDSDEEKEKKAEDKCGKDEDDSEEKEDKKESEDEDESEEKETKDDALEDIKAMIAEIKALLKSKSEDEDETKESEKEKETEDEDESEEKEKETEDEDESEEEEKKSSEDSAIWGFGQDGADSGEDEAFANYLK